ncbi:MAG: hypothetical protein WCQ23_02730 [Candidatus Methanomethylophilaceae archaeon]|jgi:sulfur carrier protein ThiS
MATIIIAGRTEEAAAGKTIEETVSSLGLRPDSYLYLVDSVPVPMDTVFNENTVVKALKVASGG